MPDDAHRGSKPNAGACRSCSSPVPQGSVFCGACGAPVSDLDSTRTAVGGSTGAPSSPMASAAPGSAAVRPPRFLPGKVIADRYRIFGLVGSGGMGEVYRADDLKLGQPVALKFLPAALENDADRMERFLGEVKIARQVAHPNVCRVYDVGEVKGQPYISMEFVDGEDLASLLRRIGRLPEDKAVQIARQICAGLAAAHDQGILHRDLKPANIMIDSRGSARITDFGLAGLAGEIRGAEVKVGTPAYMAPEQLDGSGVSIQSDLYALGLVLYELFTGEKAFDSKVSAAELKRLRSESRPATPSSLVDTLDPAVERAIMRCLEREPTDRPPSALAVSAALPGGDPLAAALAAGETPSPELVAAAGQADAMSPVLAAALSVAAMICLVAGAWINGRVSLRAFVPLEKPPAASIDRAQEMIARLGYTEPVYHRPVDRAYGYSVWDNAIDAIARRDRSAGRWEALRSPDARAVEFWYRQGPTVMVPRAEGWGSFAGGRVTRWNPFPQVTGQILVSLDVAGRLSFFVHTPRRYSAEPPADLPEPDWSLPFELAGLEIDDFERVAPRYQRYMSFEQRAAWVGNRPGPDGEPMRIEAGADDGRIVFWGIIAKGEQERLAGEPGNISNPGFNDRLFLFLITAFLAVSVVVARRNLRVGRADHNGTVRLAGFAFAVVAAREGLLSHGLFTSAGATQIYPIAATALFWAATAAALYLAIEPYARRIWPAMLVSWSRLLGRSHSWRDARIGGSVLSGVLAASLLSLIFRVQYAIVSAIDGAPAEPPRGDWIGLLGQRHAWAEIAGDLSQAIVRAFFLVLILVLGRVVLRRPAAAIVAASLIWVSLGGVFQVTLRETVIEIVVGLAVTAVWLVLLLRHGVLAMAVGKWVLDLAYMARSSDGSAWYAQPSWLAVGVVAALTVYGYWASTAGSGPRPAPIRP